MKIEYDPAKNARNVRERGLAFELVADLNWDTVIYRIDNRKAYPEDRIIVLGYLGPRLHSACITPTDEGIRVISFRKASKKEIKLYEQETADR